MDKVVSIEEATALVSEAFSRQGVAREQAQIVAKALVTAEIDGQSGHGLSRVESYLAQVKSGKVTGNAVPVMQRFGATFIRVDAAYGFAYPAIELASEELSHLAQEHGIAAATISHSHHAGQLGQHVEKLANQGLLALMMTNSPQAIAPWGGKDALLGTNPIAFAAPREKGPPLVIDLSLSKVARGKIMAAAQRGESIPQDWALDKEGCPTTNPVEALNGTMLPMGGAKGAALALVVEIFTATLSGAHYAFQASSLFTAGGPSPGLGHFLLVLSPQRVGCGDFCARLETLLERFEQQGARLPGTSRLAQRTARAKEGIRIPASLLEKLQADT